MALFNVGIDMMLRASTLLRLSTANVTDQQGDVVSEINIWQKKTNRGHLVALSSETRNSLADWILHSVKKSDSYLWTSIGNRKTRPHLTREQYANLDKQWAYLPRLDPKRHNTSFHAPDQISGHL